MVDRLQAYVTRQAEVRPDATALVMKGEQLRYGELETLSNQLARQLKDVGHQAGDRVGLLLPKSPAAIVGMLGVLKADGVYVPLDTASPVPRLAKIFRSAEPKVVLVDASSAGLLPDLLESYPDAPSLRVGTLSEDPLPVDGLEVSFHKGDIMSQAAEPMGSRHHDHDPAHLLFTSGSTGTPKGVVITHANVIGFVEWAKAYFGLSPSDKTSGHPPLHFDLSTFDIYGSFAAGAALHLVPPELNLLPHRLADFIRQHELSQWFSVPSTLTHMANLGALEQNDFPTLERLLWCGEPMPTPTLRHWMARLPHVSFTNLYGPTEATIASSYFTVPAMPEDDTTSIPIGQACAGEGLLVLDDSLGPVQVGEIGQIYIAGVGLSPGYWRDPEKTATAFLPDPRDPNERIYATGDLGKVDEKGLFYCLGRLDSQVKVRGYRIELGEIEAAMNALDEIRECAVVSVLVGGLEGTAIACAYVPQAEADVAVATIKRALSQMLPRYMLPTRWRSYEMLPKNVNGKIDRKRLKDTFQEDVT